MLFSDYIATLEAHFRKSVSNEELCGILFDGVILPIDLRNKNGEPLILDKVTVSKLMNNKQNVPKLIRDNIYEPAVLSGIVKYIEDNIVSELDPQYDDLCFQMMKHLQADYRISPQHMAQFQILATPDTVGAFLAEVFIYVVMADVRTETKKSKIQDSTIARNTENGHPVLVLKGIRGNRLSDTAYLLGLLSQPKLQLPGNRNKMISLFEDAINIHIEKPLIPAWRGISTPVTINEEERRLVMLVAKSLGVVISEDFFDLGDLQWSNFGIALSGSASLDGSNDAKEKYRCIHGIIDEIYQMLDFAPFREAFTETQCIPLALENSGSRPDDNVRIQLTFPKENILSFDDILKFDRRALKYLTDHCDFEKVFGIERGIDFLSYDSSRTRSRKIMLPAYSSPFQNNDVDYSNIVPALFDYDMMENGSHIVLDVVFDEVMQHTAIAFPQLVLLKAPISEVKYTIRSKQMPNIITGSIRIGEKS